MRIRFALIFFVGLSYGTFAIADVKATYLGKYGGLFSSENHNFVSATLIPASDGQGVRGFVGADANGGISMWTLWFGMDIWRSHLPSAAECLAYVPHSKSVVAVANQNLYAWEVEDESLERQRRYIWENVGRCEKIFASPTSERIVIATGRDTIHFLAMESANPEKLSPGHPLGFFEHKELGEVFAIYRQGQIDLLQLPDVKPKARVRLPFDFNPDYYSLSANGRVATVDKLRRDVWSSDLLDPKNFSHFVPNTPKRPIESLLLSSDGNYVLVFDKSDSLLSYEIQSGQLFVGLQSSLRTKGGGRLLAAGFSTGTYHEFDAVTSEGFDSFSSSDEKKWASWTENFPREHVATIKFNDRGEMQVGLQGLSRARLFTWKDPRALDSLRNARVAEKWDGRSEPFTDSPIPLGKGGDYLNVRHRGRTFLWEKLSVARPNANGESVVRRIDLKSGPIEGYLAVSPDGLESAVVSDEMDAKSVDIYDLVEGKYKESLSLGELSRWHGPFVYSSDSRLFAIGLNPDYRIFDRKKEAAPLAISFPDKVNGLAFGKDNESLIFLSDKHYGALALPSGKSKFLRATTVDYSPLAVTADGARAASLSSPNEISLWDTQTGAELTRISLPKTIGLILSHGTLCEISLSPDGKLLAVGTNRGMVFLWALEG